MNRTLWDKIDVQLVSMLWQSIELDLVPLFRVCKSFSEIWSHAQRLYTNDIIRLYAIISTLFNLPKGDLDMTTYPGKVQSAVTDFNIMLPITENVIEPVCPP